MKTLELTQPHDVAIARREFGGDSRLRRLTPTGFNSAIRGITRCAAACLLFLAISATSGAPSQAALVADLGTLGPGDADFTLSFESAGAFSNEYSFQVSEPVNIEAAATSFNIFGLLNISNFAGSLFEGTLASPGTELATDTGAFLTLFAGDLASDTDYFFRVSGIADGLFGGVYQAEFEVSAVPLPPAAILLVSALLALAGVGRLRRRRATVAG